MPVGAHSGNGAFENHHGIGETHAEHEAAARRAGEEGSHCIDQLLKKTTL